MLLNVLRRVVLKQPIEFSQCEKASAKLTKLMNSNDIFGVFVTLERGESDTKQMFQNWNESDLSHLQIQGCMGYWDKDYKKIINTIFLLTKILELPQTIENSDSRYNNFAKHPISDDIDAKIKITFMLLPLFDISTDGFIMEGGTSTSIVFSNNKDGIIATTNGTSAATYLPDVFPNKPFSEYKDKLIQKAGGSASDTTTFQGYKSLICDQKIYQRIDQLPFLLIPHAGIDYAGKARAKIFESMNNRQNIQNIYYVAAVHNQADPSSDHSYEWVKDELNEYFPSAKHTVYYPLDWTRSETLATELLEVSKQPLNLIIFTTDLSHYGTSFNFVTEDINSKNVSEYLKRIEQPFIDAIIAGDSVEMKELYIDNNKLACGPYSIYTLLRLIELEQKGRKGTKICYYDSNQVGSTKKTDPIESVVSYVSIKFDY